MITHQKIKTSYRQQAAVVGQSYYLYTVNNVKALQSKNDSWNYCEILKKNKLREILETELYYNYKYNSIQSVSIVERS